MGRETGWIPKKREGKMREKLKMHLGNLKIVSATSLVCLLGYL